MCHCVPYEPGKRTDLMDKVTTWVPNAIYFQTYRMAMRIDGRPVMYCVRVGKLGPDTDRDNGVDMKDEDAD